jgi:soluble lytic murein transglycosylase-like protein
VARALAATFDANREAVAAWIEDGDPGTWPPPREVVLLTLYEQRILRELAAHPKLAARVLDRLRGRAARESAANVAAGRALFEHFTPVEEVPDFRIRRPEPADALLGYFVEAEERFGVAREVLAAIMLVETRMGRIRSRSSAGAQGPMQFLPSTWAAYGLGGDVRDPHDAVLGAANYLRASGAPGDYRAALRAYNPVDAYVAAVLRYAGTMRRFPDSYYVFYDWQVFVRTVDGDVRLSGPGL